MSKSDRPSRTAHGLDVLISYPVRSSSYTSYLELGLLALIGQELLQDGGPLVDPLGQIRCHLVARHT